ncbi:MAG: PilZ domain-containing protein, partial [Thermodesulfobacteriota bacterium]|nr:PilZ domain-containing protein [Thermodesulfobacteriota bacterium]
SNFSEGRNMLYYITILIIFLVLGFVGIILFKKITYFQTQKKKLQEKESEFINKLFTEADLKSAQYFQTGDFIENHTVNSEKHKNMGNNELGINEVRAFIQDISESGVFMKTSQTFSLGQPILMTFMSPDNQKPFRINGEIKHTQEDGIGVKFKIKSQVQGLVLKSFVDMIQSG